MKRQAVERLEAGGGGASRLSEWEQLVVEAVGSVIEYWGFKANEGRVWALLYLHGRPFCAAEIGRSLGLSKGAVSMVTREMEAWGVLRRLRGAGAGVWQYEAETDFIEMIRRVLTAREARFVARVKADLERAEKAAKRAAPPEVVERIARMKALAELVERAVEAFLRTARFDVRGALGILSVKRPAAKRAPPQAEERGRRAARWA
ncbi:MAG TPA: transcriptional regulator [Myxococcales bacterium]|nr:transcriptional regulator [Myxococcales bacterium]